MAQSVEKAKRNQTINREDITNQSTRSNADDSNRGRESKAGEFETDEFSSKTLKSGFDA